MSLFLNQPILNYFIANSPLSFILCLIVKEGHEELLFLFNTNIYHDIGNIRKEITSKAL